MTDVDRSHNKFKKANGTHTHKLSRSTLTDVNLMLLNARRRPISSKFSHRYGTARDVILRELRELEMPTTNDGPDKAV